MWKDKVFELNMVSYFINNSLMQSILLSIQVVEITLNKIFIREFEMQPKNSTSIKLYKNVYLGKLLNGSLLVKFGYIKRIRNTHALHRTILTEQKTVTYAINFIDTMMGFSDCYKNYQKKEGLKDD